MVAKESRNKEEFKRIERGKLKPKAKTQAKI